MEQYWDPDAIPEGVHVLSLSDLLGAKPSGQQASSAEPAHPAPSDAVPAVPPVLTPGSAVLVAWADGNRYPATLAQMDRHYWLDCRSGAEYQ